VLTVDNWQFGTAQDNLPKLLRVDLPETLNFLEPPEHFMEERVKAAAEAFHPQARGSWLLKS
jgi:hypothetical protein